MKKKLSLADLKVKSFVTTNQAAMKKVVGGRPGQTDVGCQITAPSVCQAGL